MWAGEAGGMQEQEDGRRTVKCRLLDMHGCCMHENPLVPVHKQARQHSRMDMGGDPEALPLAEELLAV